MKGSWLFRELLSFTTDLYLKSDQNLIFADLQLFETVIEQRTKLSLELNGLNFHGWMTKHACYLELLKSLHIVVLALQLVTCLLESSNKSTVSSESFGAIDDAIIVRI